MKYKIGDSVRIINKTTGSISWESFVKRYYSEGTFCEIYCCDHINNEYIIVIYGNKFYFNENDLQPSKIIHSNI